MTKDLLVLGSQSISNNNIFGTLYLSLKTIGNNNYRPVLGLVILLAVLLRLIIPILDLTTGESPWFYQFVQPAQYDTEKLSFNLVKVIFEGNDSPSDKTWVLGAVRGEWAYIAWLVICKLVAAIFGLDYHVLTKIKILQALLDGIVGTVLIHSILTRVLSPAKAVIGSLVYAVWLPAIFYCNHICAESFTHLLMLASALLFIRALEKESISRWLSFSLFSGFTICFRLNNILVFFLYIVVALFWKKRPKIKLLTLSFMLIAGLMIPSKIFNKLIPLTGKMDMYGGILYNAMGEYPGTFKGLRFFDDGKTLAHLEKSEEKYLNEGDPFVTAAWRLYPKGLGLYTAIREIIFEKPILYADWVVRRFIVYLPAHPYVASIIYFLSNDTAYNARRSKENYKGIYGYRFSQRFNGLKYIDYLIFSLFAWGVWLARKSPLLLTILCVYFGVHIFHVLTENGEVFFIHDAEGEFLELRYLLGMVAVWPVFIAISLSKLIDKWHSERA